MEKERVLQKGAALRHELETLAPRPLGLIFSSKADFGRKLQGSVSRALLLSSKDHSGLTL